MKAFLSLSCFFRIPIMILFHFLEIFHILMIFKKSWYDWENALTEKYHALLKMFCYLWWCERELLSKTEVWVGLANRINIGWANWSQASGLLCNCCVSPQLEVAFTRQQLDLVCYMELNVGRNKKQQQYS